MILQRELILCGFFLSSMSCSDYSVQMPTTLETFHGSCILIPCSFTTKEYHMSSPATGVWRKGSQWFESGVDVFNSSKSQNKLQGEILGDLTLWNCTSVLYGFTRDYEDNYYFRLESKVVKLTFAEYVSIKVNEVLPKPHLTSPQSFQEGVLSSMICALASKALCLHDPPTLIWRPKLNGSRVLLRTQADGTKEIISMLSFMPSRSHNNLSVSCVVEHKGITPVQETLLLTVLYGPENLSVSLNPAQFEVGSPITLSCLGASNPPIENYRWFQNASGYLREMEWTSQNFTFNATHSASGAYHCEGRNAVGASNSSALQMEVPDSLWLNQFKPQWWPLIAAGFILLCVVGAALFHRHKKSQQHQNGKEPDLKSRVVDPDIYINVTEETLRRAADAPDAPKQSDSVYCNQFQPDRTKQHDFMSQMDNAIYINH